MENEEKMKETLVSMLQGLDVSLEDWNEVAGTMNDVLEDCGMNIRIDDFGPLAVAVSYFSEKILHTIIIDSDAYCAFLSYEDMAETFMSYEEQALSVENKLPALV